MWALVLLLVGAATAVPCRKLEYVYSDKTCATPVAVTYSVFDLPVSSCPFVCKASPCGAYVGADQNPAGPWGMSVQCPGDVDLTKLLNGTAMVVTTYSDAQCSVPVSVFGVEIDKCTPTALPVPPYATASYKYSSCTTGHLYTDLECSVLDPNPMPTSPPSSCNMAATCCQLGPSIYVHSSCKDRSVTTAALTPLMPSIYRAHTLFEKLNGHTLLTGNRL